jgi:hypothetical protein
MDGEENLLQRYLHRCVFVLPWWLAFHRGQNCKIWCFRDETSSTHSPKQRLVNCISTVTDRHDDGDTVARGSLPRPPWGTFSPRTKGAQNISPWRWRQYIPLKRRFLQEPHYVITSQETAFFRTVNVPAWIQTCELPNASHKPESWASNSLLPINLRGP